MADQGPLKRVLDVFNALERSEEKKDNKSASIKVASAWVSSDEYVLFMLKFLLVDH